MLNFKFYPLIVFTLFTFFAIMSLADSDEIVPGDIVAVHHGNYGRQEGLVLGSYIDFAGRQIVAVQLDSREVYNAWYPHVTRVKRTISVARPSANKRRTIERSIYW